MLDTKNSMVSFYDSFQKYKLRCLLQQTTTISFVDVKMTFKLLSNTMNVFHGVENDLIFKYRKTLRRISS